MKTTEKKLKGCDNFLLFPKSASNVQNILYQERERIICTELLH